MPFREDPQRYAWSNRLVPQSCEADVVALLTEVHRRTAGRIQNDPDAFDALQNAVVAANAETEPTGFSYPPPLGAPLSGRAPADQLWAAT